jgi:hypothetical protein
MMQAKRLEAAVIWRTRGGISLQEILTVDRAKNCRLARDDRRQDRPKV